MTTVAHRSPHAAGATVCHVLDVRGRDGLLGVERVLSVLRQRQYGLRRLRVEGEIGTPSAWSLHGVVTSTHPRLLLLHRLQRLPSVTDVRVASDTYVGSRAVE